MMEPQERIGLSTSFLPRMRSTTELLGPETGGGGGIRTPEAMTQLIYSQSPLTTWVPHREQPDILPRKRENCWSSRPDSNRKPTAYKAVALPD